VLVTRPGNGLVQTDFYFGFTMGLIWTSLNGLISKINLGFSSKVSSHVFELLI
jgi:hypothetical protein